MGMRTLRSRESESLAQLFLVGVGHWETRVVKFKL